MVASLFTCYGESQTHSFAALTRLLSLGVVIQPFSGRGAGEGGREKVSDKKHIPAILDAKSPQTPLFVYLQAILSFYGHIISPNPQASKNLPEEQIF